MSLKEKEERKDGKMLSPLQHVPPPPPLKMSANLQARLPVIGQWLVRWYGIPLSRTGT